MPIEHVDRITLIANAVARLRQEQEAAPLFPRTEEELELPRVLEETAHT